MNVNALAIYLGGKAPAHRIGVLFRYELAPDTVTQRFVADEAYLLAEHPPLLSQSLTAANPQQQALLWRDITSTPLNGRYSARNGWMLPAFFQNLLPEGAFRDHIAELRGCDPRDQFEMLAACGRDLPGHVYALPVDLTREELTHYITQDQDALEMSVSAEPMDDGVSISGVQPKLAVGLEGDRYVARTKLGDTHLIAKLPVVGYPRLPELEDLSLRLAAAAGVRACTTELVPLERLAAEHNYDLGDVDASTTFLAVHRYDRDQPGRVHCEDFCQVLGVWPEDKYSGASYQGVAAVLLDLFDEEAVHELLRRLLVNELLGNPDMHLKNIGLRYADGRTAEFPPAYDIVGYAAYQQRRGHALHLLEESRLQAGAKPRVVAKNGAAAPKPSLSPMLLRQFCADLGIPEKPAAAVLRQCAERAMQTWPDMISQSGITSDMKARLLVHFQSHPAVAGLLRRQSGQPAGQANARKPQSQDQT